MHIHASLNSQIAPLSATQAAQQTAETKRAALAVRKKLTDFAASADGDAVTHVDTQSGDQSDSRQKRSQPDPEKFRSVFFSLAV
jgi:hypothetical protein